MRLAAFTQFSTKQVRRWIKSGALTATKLGRHWRIAENDLALFLTTLRSGKPVPLAST
jgi:excisionase family DNA binding protein